MRRKSISILSVVLIILSSSLQAAFVIQAKYQPNVAEDSSQTEEASPAQETNQPALPSDENGAVFRYSPGTNSPAPTNGAMTFRVAPQPLSTMSPIKEKRQGDKVIDEDGTEYPLRQYSTMSLPNDPLANQWWVSNVNMTSAWGFGHGPKQTLLAIIDTGYALGHQDFVSRWHINPLESGPTEQENPSILNCSDRGLPLDRSCNNIDDNLDGIINNESGTTTQENPSILNCTARGLSLDKSCNLIDDSGNGLIDDVRGWDFATSYPSSQAGKMNPDGGSATTHGTLVAGIAAATGNNGVGIAGVDWQTKILPLQAIDDDGYGDTITVSRAIRYAADMGADVISMSLGTAYPDSYLRQAVAYAIGKGSIVLAASGNDGCQCISYPARYDEVIAVGASTADNVPASFSSYGATLDLLAPGENMTSTTWHKNNQTSAYASGANGTSFATPLVAGLLTMMRSHQPDATAHQLIGVLNENVNRLGLPITTPRSNTLGFGRVDAGNSLGRVSSTLSPQLQYMFLPVSGGRTSGIHEPAGVFRVTQCLGSQHGSTAIHKLTRNQHIFYTISWVERYKAQAVGYSSTTLGSSFCIDLPTDTPLGIRMLSVPYEFENRATVKY